LQLAELFSALGGELSKEDTPAGVLDRLAHLCVRRVPGAQYAGITIGRSNNEFETVGATDDLVHQVDQIQYDLGSGPCVDAVLDNTTFRAGDLRTDPRWPDFGRRAVELTGILSMLSLRLYLEDDSGVIAGLNMYSHTPDAFTDLSESLAVLLATHAAVAAAKAQAERKVHNLEIALRTSRDIGIAVGILMATQKVTADQAFDLLRIASQHTHRKLREIAAQVAETGELPSVPR
jgi:GAF domain-containing protein